MEHIDWQAACGWVKWKLCCCKERTGWNTLHLKRNSTLTWCLCFWTFHCLMNWRVLVLCAQVSSHHGFMSKTLVLSAQRCTVAAERETAIMCLGSVCSPEYQVPSFISAKSLMSIYMYIFHMCINIHSVWAIAICPLSVSRLKPTHD